MTKSKKIILSFSILFLFVAFNSLIFLSTLNYFTHIPRLQEEIFFHFDPLDFLFYNTSSLSTSPYYPEKIGSDVARKGNYIKPIMSADYDFTNWPIPRFFTRKTYMRLIVFGVPYNTTDKRILHSNITGPMPEHNSTHVFGTWPSVILNESYSELIVRTTLYTTANQSEIIKTPDILILIGIFRNYTVGEALPFAYRYSVLIIFSYPLFSTIEILLLVALIYPIMQGINLVLKLVKRNQKKKK